jgi:hypothetical protein
MHMGNDDVQGGDQRGAKRHATERPGGTRIAERRRHELSRRDQQHDTGREPDAEGEGAGVLLQPDREPNAEQRRQARHERQQEHDGPCSGGRSHHDWGSDVPAGAPGGRLRYEHTALTIEDRKRFTLATLLRGQIAA